MSPSPTAWERGWGEGFPDVNTSCCLFRHIHDLRSRDSSLCFDFQQGQAGFDIVVTYNATKMDVMVKADMWCIAALDRMVRTGHSVEMNGRNISTVPTHSVSPHQNPEHKLLLATPATG